MGSRNLLLTGLAILVVLAGVLFLLKNNSGSPQTGVNAPTPFTTEAKEGIVQVTTNGFNPDSLTVASGAKVVWKNESGGEATVNSDSHPTHQLWRFLNLGTFPNGSSVTVVFEDPGTYTYHNHLNPTQRGTIVVK